MIVDLTGATAFVLEVSVRAAAAAILVALVLCAARVRDAAVRHLAWTVVVVAMLLMPVLPSIIPPLPLAVPASRPANTIGEAVAPPLASTAIPVAPPSVTGAPLPAPRMNGLPSIIESATSHGPIGQSGAGLLLAAAVYGAGAVLFLSRLLYGWYLASTLIRRARRRGAIQRESGRRVYESPEVAVPMTAGVLRPAVILPSSWRQWPAEMLTAILAHELAHVRRRDPLTLLLARLNRALFWFHPLAWWLERTLAVTAEHVCDEAATGTVAEPRRYAQILVEMADAVRRNRGRIAWQGVGVDGAGLLQGRIDRVLRNGPLAPPSIARKLTVGFACGAAVLLVAACRQQVSAVALREDPEVTRRLAEQDERTKEFEVARDMTQAEADALEQRLAANPQDFDIRRQLVTYYRASSNVAWDNKVPGLRRHALWLIEHHPEHELQAPALSPEYDPEGFAAARQLWQAHLTKPSASPFLVFRAAQFFVPHDKPFAEQLILRGTAMDPDSAALRARMPPNVAGYQWPSQLADVYASAILGSENVWGTYNDLRTRPEKLNTPFGQEVRTKLDTSTNPQLLASVGGLLSRPRGPTSNPALRESIRDAQELGIKYLQRALELEPTNTSARRSLFLATAREHRTEADRLAGRANEGYMRSEFIEYSRKDQTAARQARAEAQAQAEAVLKMAEARPHDPAYSWAVMTAHQVLATIAMRNGDRERALRHLRDSVEVPASQAIQYATPPSWMKPVNYLLRAGERDSVADILERLAELSLSEGQRFQNDAKAIREGRMPLAYQYMVVREGG